VTGLPFMAVVGAGDARLALLLGAVDPGIGGVLLTGEKGTAKTTLVRGLAGILPGVSVVAKCRFSCDPASPDPGCPDGPHPPGSAATHRPARLVELPLGATDDNVTGSLDVPRVLAGAGTAEAFAPGLLALANRGVLYVDEINLLPDHIVDVLLDAAATGSTSVEREGVSLRHASSFLLVGTMNPEEGELRPQLLDRFGLCVPVVASTDPERRAAVVRAQLEHDRSPSASAHAFESLERDVTIRIAAARARLGSVQMTDAELLRITTACAALGVDGMRGDLVTCRAAIAHAAWRQRDEVTGEDVRVAARLALPHRQRRGPFDDPGADAAKLDEALGPDVPEEEEGDLGPDEAKLDEALGPGAAGSGAAGEAGRPDTDPDGDGPDDGGGGGGRPGPGENGGEPPPSRAQDAEPRQDPAAPAPAGTSAPPGAAFQVRRLTASGLGWGNEGRRSGSRGPHGRPIASIRSSRRPELLPTLRAAVLARRAAPGAAVTVTAGDLRVSLRRGRESNLIVLLLDTSGSMAARRRSAAVGTAALSLLDDAYRRRDKVALLTFRGDGATVVVPPTSSVELAARRLRDLPVGGRTPLAAGLEASRQLVRRERWRDPARRPIVVVITDGRATGGRAAVAEANRSAAALARTGATSIVVDAEEGPVRLGLAAEIAGHLAAELVTIPGLAAAAGPVREQASSTLASLIRAREAAA
jgi:magnesium chelatase subunit D